jgi:hypothetical protein
MPLLPATRATSELHRQCARLAHALLLLLVLLLLVLVVVQPAAAAVVGC